MSNDHPKVLVRIMSTMWICWETNNDDKDDDDKGR